VKTMSNHKFKHLTRKQNGVVLLTSLIFLLVLSMIVLAALRTGTLEERMAANARNRQVALQAAEAVLRSAEVASFTGVGSTSKFSSYNLAAGYYNPPAAGVNAIWKTVDWSSATATLTAGVALEGLSSTPRYIVEIIDKPRPQLGSGCTKGIARITARGMGRDSSIVFVQAMYRYQSDNPSDGC
jgi:type IV pilus assembly protein PilX